MIRTPNGVECRRRLRQLAFLILLLAVSRPASSQKDRLFSIPLEDLRTWSRKVIVPLNVEVSGHSKVHKVEADCEMHFGAKASGYDGDPDGWVLEPMNLCLESFPGKSGHSNKDWEDFGDSLKGARVRVEGIPRIWPEHLIGGGPSNPNHAVELHPLVKLQRGNHVYDFTSFVYAPDGFPGGLFKAAQESHGKQIAVPNVTWRIGGRCRRISRLQ